MEFLNFTELLNERSIRKAHGHVPLGKFDSDYYDSNESGGLAVVETT
jgi:hypothetical protein